MLPIWLVILSCFFFLFWSNVICVMCACVYPVHVYGQCEATKLVVRKKKETKNYEKKNKFQKQNTNPNGKQN